MEIEFKITADDTTRFGRGTGGGMRFRTVAILFGVVALFLAGEARGAAPTLTAATVQHAGSTGDFTSVTMTDDGTTGDTTADDGVFGAQVPTYTDDLPRYLFTYTLVAATEEEKEEGDVGTTPTTLFINELMASNSTTILDPQGDDDDWIELKNTGTAAIDLGGMYLSDKRASPLKWQFPAGTTIAAGGYLLVWADDDAGDSPGLHTNFKLSAGGESVVLSDIDARDNAVIDSVDFPAQTTDISYGRSPEGTGSFQALATASPGRATPTVPEIAISADGPVTEGGTATFTLTASPAPTADIVVTVAVTQGTGDDYLPTTLPTSVTLAAGATETTLSVAIPDDTTDEPNGVLTVTVTSGTGYTVSATAGSASLTIRDDDVTPATSAVVINELMASNSTILDPQGDADDWIELKNTGPTALDLSGMYLSDDRANPLKWQFPAGTTIAAGGYLLIWADNDEGDSPGLHTNFKLSADGESVVLSDTDANGNALIDAVDFPALGRDVSYGRTPEGSGSFRIRPAATPGAANPALAAPVITAVALTSTPTIDADGDGTPETYGVGATIEVTVTWDADVVWDVSAAGAAIKLDLDLGGHDKRLSMVADGTSGTARALVFQYVVQSTDTDADGIFPKPWGRGTDLVLLIRGATLTSADGGRHARRGHAVLAPDPAHQVNGGLLPSGAPNPQRPAPAITAVALTSTPTIDADNDGVAETYGAGETIAVTVTWDVDVAWDVSATDAAIKLVLDIGGTDRRMSLVTDGSRGTARALVFHYVVQRPDRDTDGIFPKPGGGGTDLVLLTRGATLTSADGSRQARRGHVALAPDPAHQVNGRSPAITAVALTSTPSIDADSDSVPETYGVGETIAVTVTWDADVVWDVSAADAAIKLVLDIGGTDRRMSLVAAGTSGTARALVFHYVVQRPDIAPDGIFPKPGGGGTDLVLLTRGATLTSADGSRQAWRGHAALAPDPAHQVDGSVTSSTPSHPPRARALAAGPGAHGGRRGDDTPTLAFLAGAAQERRVEPHRPAGFPIGPPVAATGADPLAWALDDPAGLFAIDPATGQLRMAVDGAAVFAVLADGWFRWHDDPTTRYLSLVFDLTVRVTDALGRASETRISIRVTADTPGDVDLSTYAPQVGTAIAASVSDPDGVLPDSVRWQWEYDDGKWQEDAAGWLVPHWQAVEGATGATFTPSADLAGAAVRAVVRYADGLSGPDEPAKQAASASTDAIQ